MCRPDMYKFYGFETRFSIVGSATEGVDAAAFPRPVTATQSVFFIDEGETLYVIGILNPLPRCSTDNVVSNIPFKVSSVRMGA